MAEIVSASRASTPNTYLLEKHDTKGGFSGFHADVNRQDLTSDAVSARKVILDHNDVGRRVAPTNLLRAHAANHRERTQSTIGRPGSSHTVVEYKENGIATFQPYSRVGVPPVAGGWMHSCSHASDAFKSAIPPNKPRAAQTFALKKTFTPLARVTVYFHPVNLCPNLDV